MLGSLESIWYSFNELYFGDLKFIEIFFMKLFCNWILSILRIYKQECVNSTIIFPFTIPNVFIYPLDLTFRKRI